MGWRGEPCAIGDSPIGSDGVAWFQNASTGEQMTTDDAELDRLRAAEREAHARFNRMERDFSGHSELVEGARQLWSEAREALDAAELRTISEVK